MTVQPIRPAATVILVRDGYGGGAHENVQSVHGTMQVFMVRRASSAAFAGGMFVFPGGRVDGDDHLHAYDRWRVGPAEQQLHQRRALGPEWRGFWIAGIRESFEEAGLLLAYDPQGQLLRYESAAVRDRFDGYRAPLHAGRMSLADICERENLRLAVDRIHFHNRFVTPFGRPRRFDTRFFVAEAPAGQTGRHDARETVDSVWINPREALEASDRCEFDLMRVTRIQLEELPRHASAGALLESAAARREFPVFRPQVPVEH